jgi:hypothetical protein
MTPAFTVRTEDADYKSVTFSGCEGFRRQRPETTSLFGLT